MHTLRAFGSDDALKGLENAGEAVRSPWCRMRWGGGAIALALPQIKTEESSNKWLEPLRAVVTRACTEVNNRCGTCSVFGNGNTPLFRPLESKGEVYMKERGLARDRVAMVALLKHTLLTQESVEKTDAERKQVASRAGEMVKNYMQDERRLVQRGEEEAAAGRSAEDAKLLQRQQEMLQSRLEGADVESLARGAAHVRMRCEGKRAGKRSCLRTGRRWKGKSRHCAACSSRTTCNRFATRARGRSSLCRWCFRRRTTRSWWRRAGVRDRWPSRATSRSGACPRS